ncbi:MAG: hypothetical protein JWO70_4420 [Betaproteobacteria bacterium]|jgi:hypothetical protein|nr:hypothetical protein [Betaproteobacteria bacterium]
MAAGHSPLDRRLCARSIQSFAAFGYIHSAVVVAVVLVDMVQVPVHHIIDVIAVRHGLMTAAGTVLMPGCVTCTFVTAGASVRILRTHCNHVFGHCAAFLVMQMSVV